VKVLVLGGTQFNGLALVRELVRTGHDVTILNRGKSPGAVPRGVRRLVADRTDLASMRAALGSEDYDVVHDVTAYRPEDVAFMLEHFRGRTGHYVFVSSTVIYAASDLLPIHEDFPVDRSPQQNEYGRLKLECEDLLLRARREHGFPATTVCLSMVFGPHNILPDREQRMFVRLSQGRPILIPGDGTTLAQVGFVGDQARALRMLMGKPATFGRRYNLTGADFFSAEGYVDTFARVVGVEPNKVFVPAPLMDDLFDGRVVARPVQVKAKVDIRSTERPDELQRNRFLLSMLVQRIAPHIHRWNRSVVFGIDRLRQDVGFEPEYRFSAAVAQTYEWFQAERVAEKQSFDFSFEDEVLRLVQAAPGAARSEP
jgi:nucleoside-diphosphate-sugar epimerase